MSSSSAEKLVRLSKAGEELVRGAEHVRKSDSSLVTEIDVLSEKLLIEGLSALLPDSKFLAEEGHGTHDGDLHNLWIIDPIDGTTNFIHGIAAWCISIALYVEGRPVLGVVYDVPHATAYSACEGVEGMSVEGQSAEVSTTEQLSDALLATGFPISAIPQLDDYLRILGSLMTRTHGIRRIGAAALDLAWVACGKFDGFFEYNLKPWDVAAGAYLVHKAGGKVTTFSGGDDFLFARQILASNGRRLHVELLEAMR